VRAVIRHRFEKNRYVSDPKVIDLLIHKSRQDYQETVNFWKQESHVLGPLLNNRDRPHRTFLQKFYEGGFSCPFCVAAVDPPVSRFVSFIREGRGCYSPRITQCVIFPAFI
jgi:hypothetical protein